MNIENASIKMAIDNKVKVILDFKGMLIFIVSAFGYSFKLLQEGHMFLKATLKAFSSVRYRE
jgi:hypothetical protein